MKKMYIIIGFIAILVNSLIGIIFIPYQSFNWLTADVIIIINMFLLRWVYQSKISDGFKVSLAFILPLLGLIAFLMSLTLEIKFENNISLAGILVLLAIQLALLTITKHLKNQ